MEERVDSKELVRRFYEEVWVRGNVGAISDFLAETYVDHSDTPRDGTARQALERIVGWFRDNTEERTVDIDFIAAEGDRLAVFWTMRWLNHGDFFGAPAEGRWLTLMGGHFYRVVDEKLAEIWHAEDYLRLFAELGLHPKL